MEEIEKSFGYRRQSYLGMENNIKKNTEMKKKIRWCEKFMKKRSKHFVFRRWRNRRECDKLTPGHPFIRHKWRTESSVATCHIHVASMESYFEGVMVNLTKLNYTGCLVLKRQNFKGGLFKRFSIKNVI